jgi:DNA helicase-2/ATP-dependent DNA helicase PcrA
MRLNSWQSVSDRKLYLRAAEELRGNAGQWAAYESTAHCVMLAGPGSGKTKTLTIKLARMLSEDVEEPRGIACITYNNECARELEQRLDALGVEPGGRVFIGTVHSFSLTQIVLPYAKTAGLGLPDKVGVAMRQQTRAALEDAYNAVIGGADNPQSWDSRMGRYRRAFLNRNEPAWRGQDAQLAALVEAYEKELRNLGVIDFDDMPLLAVRALRENPWLQRALLAKYPILAVDEYQDLGRALHRMVMGLCFGAGIRLLAVGDVDQSIYGFTGADPALLQRLSERQDVETVRLRLNYRCGSRIVTASSYALGEDRDYSAPEGAHEGTIYFHPRNGTLRQQADYLFSTILPQAMARMTDIGPGDIAILYPTAAIGDDVASAAEAHGHPVVRTDGNALYPRSSRLMRWLELCAVWCCDGWKTGSPRFSKLVAEGCRIFGEVIVSGEERRTFQLGLVQFLWARRDGTASLNGWLRQFRQALLADMITGCPSIADEGETLNTIIGRTAHGGVAAAMTLGQFSGHGDGNDRINLSTLHSAKGREFSLVVMFAMNHGLIPWFNVGTQQILESRRLFYVGFTRTKRELHLMYTTGNASPFVVEVQNRLEEDE